MSEERSRFDVFVHWFARIALLLLVSGLGFMVEREINREAYRKADVQEMIAQAVLASEYSFDKKHISEKLKEITILKEQLKSIFQALQVLGLAVNNSLAVTPRDVLGEVEKVKVEVNRLRDSLELIQRFNEQEIEKIGRILQLVEDDYRNTEPRP